MVNQVLLNLSIGSTFLNVHALRVPSLVVKEVLQNSHKPIEMGLFSVRHTARKCDSYLAPKTFPSCNEHARLPHTRIQA